MEIDVEAEQKAIRNSLMMVDSEVTARNLNRNSDVLIRSIMENGAESNANANSINTHSTTKQTKAGRHASSSSRLSIQALSDLADGEEEAVATATNMNLNSNPNANNTNNVSNAKRNKPHAPLPSAVVAATKRQSDFELFPGLGLNIGDRSSIASSLSITTVASVNATSSANSRNTDSASDKNTNTSTNSMAVDSPHSDLDLQVAAVLVDQRSFIPLAVTNQYSQTQYNNHNNNYHNINPQLVFHQQFQQQQVYQSQSPLSQQHNNQATPTPPATSPPQLDMQTPRQQTPLIPQLQQMGPDDDDDAMIDDLYDHVRDTFGRLHSATSTSAKSPPESLQQHQEQQLFQQSQMLLLQKQQREQQSLHQYPQYQKYAETEQPSQISWINGNQISGTAIYNRNETGNDEDEDVNTKRSSTRRIMSLFRAAEAAARDAELEERARTNAIQISANQGGIQSLQPQQLYYQLQEQTYQQQQIQSPQQQQQYERQVSVSTTDFDSDGDSDSRFGSMGGSQHEGSVATTPPSHLLPFVCDICSRAFLRKHDLKRHVLTTHGTTDAFKCETCMKSFTRSDALQRHLKGRCKGLKAVAAATAKLASVG
ncbi:hypothetical protein HK100_008791 [Physocladia obscura]|uniref:C2H2-type domain-containing protein n=1 Tax=Physocladia obscura TaxID=109957 RepID=A0AAD5XJK5_9FUNG|nr:hypothetical protein HK100_008791 [Physocladia obscura]